MKTISKKKYQEIERLIKEYLIEKYQGEDITYFNDEICIGRRIFFVEAGLSVYEQMPYKDGNSMSWIEDGYKDMTFDDVEVFKIEQVINDDLIELVCK